jgi:hypothetical protein
MIVDSAAPWTDTEFISRTSHPSRSTSRTGSISRRWWETSLAGQESLNEYLKMLFLSDAKRTTSCHGSPLQVLAPVNEALNADLGKFDMWPLSRPSPCRRW